MKGLLIKDLHILKKQKSFFGLALLIAFIFLISDTVNIMFAIGYMTIMFSFASTSTITYDQHGNGMGFLLTLPVSRRDYVKEKYILMFLIAGVSLICSFLFLTVGVCMDHIPSDQDILLGSLLSTVLWTIMVHVLMIPLFLKFGAEKSRIALILVMGIIYAVIFGGRALIRYFDIDIIGLADLISQTSRTILITIGCMAAAVLLGISILISLHVMKKKEY